MKLSLLFITIIRLIYSGNIVWAFTYTSTTNLHLIITEKHIVRILDQAKFHALSDSIFKKIKILIIDYSWIHS